MSSSWLNGDTRSLGNFILRCRQKDEQRIRFVERPPSERRSPAYRRQGVAGPKLLSHVALSSMRIVGCAVPRALGDADVYAKYGVAPCGLVSACTNEMAISLTVASA